MSACFLGGRGHLSAAGSDSSPSEFPTMSLIRSVIFQRDSWSFCTVHAVLILCYSFSRDQTVDESRSRTERTGRTEGRERRAEVGWYSLCSWLCIILFSPQIPFLKTFSRFQVNPCFPKIFLSSAVCVAWKDVFMDGLKESNSRLTIYFSFVGGTKGKTSDK